MLMRKGKGYNRVIMGLRYIITQHTINSSMCMCAVHRHWRWQDFSFWGYSPEGLGDESPPVGSRGEAPTDGLWDKLPQKLKTVYRHCLLIDFNYRNDQNFAQFTS